MSLEPFGYPASDELDGVVLVDITTGLADALQEEVNLILESEGLKEPAQDSEAAELQFLVDRWRNFFQRMQADGYQVYLMKVPR